MNIDLALRKRYPSAPAGSWELADHGEGPHLAAWAINEDPPGGRAAFDASTQAKEETVERREAAIAADRSRFEATILMEIEHALDASSDQSAAAQAILAEREASAQAAQNAVRDADIAWEQARRAASAALVGALAAEIAAADFEVAMATIRTARDALLAKCDWTQVSDAPLSAAEKTAWKTYRQALRDYPETVVDPAAPPPWPGSPDDPT